MKVIIFTKLFFLSLFYFFFSAFSSFYFCFFLYSSSSFLVCLLKYIIAVTMHSAPKKLLSPGIDQLIREHWVRKRLTLDVYS